jgi:hypothetical protein
VWGVEKEAKELQEARNEKPAVWIAVEPVGCGVLKKKPKKFQEARNERTTCCSHVSPLIRSDNRG